MKDLNKRKFLSARPEDAASIKLSMSSSRHSTAVDLDLYDGYNRAAIDLGCFDEESYQDTKRQIAVLKDMVELMESKIDAYYTDFLHQQAKYKRHA